MKKKRKKREPQRTAAKVPLDLLSLSELLPEGVPALVGKEWSRVAPDVLCRPGYVPFVTDVALAMTLANGMKALEAMEIVRRDGFVVKGKYGLELNPHIYSVLTWTNQAVACAQRTLGIHYSDEVLKLIHRETFTNGQSIEVFGKRLADLPPEVLGEMNKEYNLDFYSHPEA